MTDRYTPKLGSLRELHRDPIVSQDITWNYGPNFGDPATMTIRRTGKTVEIQPSRGDTLSMPVEHAVLLVKALENVIGAYDYE